MSKPIESATSRDEYLPSDCSGSASSSSSNVPISASHSIPEAGYLRLPEVLKLIPVSRSAWWLGIKQGRFPRGIKLGPRTTAWKVSDICALIDQLDEGNRNG